MEINKLNKKAMCLSILVGKNRHQSNKLGFLMNATKKLLTKNGLKSILNKFNDILRNLSIKVIQETPHVD